MTITLIRVIPVICAISVMWEMSVAKVNLAMREISVTRAVIRKKKGKRICKGLKISVMGVISTTSIKSSRSQMFFKIGVLKNFAIFTGKHVCNSLFLIKLKACNFIEKRLQKVFCRTFLNLFLRTPILKSISIGCICNKSNECNISYE